MNRIEEIQKELEELKIRQQNKEQEQNEVIRKAEEAKYNATIAAKKAKEAQIKAEEAKKKTEDAAKAIEEAKAYEDETPTYEDTYRVNSTSSETTNKKTTTNNSTKIKITYLATGVIVTLLSIGGCKLIKEAKSGKTIPSPTPFTITQTTPNNTSNTSTTPIPEKTLTDEAFVKLVNEVTDDLVENGIKLTQDEITSYVLIVNIEKIARDNPELIEKVIAEKDPSTVLQDAYTVLGARTTYNYSMYSLTNSTNLFLDPTSIVFGNEQQDKVKTIVKKVNEISKIEDNEEFNDAVIELLDFIYDPTEKVYNLDAGTILILQEVLEPVRGLYGTVKEQDDRFNERGLNAIKYLVPYVTDEEKYIDNALSSGAIRDINAILKDCQKDKELSLTETKTLKKII